MATSTEDLLRELAPQVLGVLMRRYGGLDTCEDAVQEALLDAATQWPASGTPDNPRGWLLTVATRRLTEGQPAVTDGPYLETKEYLASWYLIDVDSEERALEIAAELPSAKSMPVEVWPILHEASRETGVDVGVV